MFRHVFAPGGCLKHHCANTTKNDQMYKIPSVSFLKFLEIENLYFNVRHNFGGDDMLGSLLSYIIDPPFGG